MFTKYLQENPPETRLFCGLNCEHDSTTLATSISLINLVIIQMPSEYILSLIIVRTNQLLLKISLAHSNSATDTDDVLLPIHPENVTPIHFTHHSIGSRSIFTSNTTPRSDMLLCYQRSSYIHAILPRERGCRAKCLKPNSAIRIA